MTSSVVGPRSSSKALPKAKLAPQKSHSHCLVVCCPSDPLHFLNPSETITREKYAKQIDDIYQKLQGLRSALVNIKGPNLLYDNIQPHVTQPTLHKLNKLTYKVLPHLPYSPDLLPTDYHFFEQFDNFMQRKCFHNQQDVEMLSKDSSNPESRFFTL